MLNQFDFKALSINSIMAVYNLAEKLGFQLGWRWQKHVTTWATLVLGVLITRTFHFIFTLQSSFLTIMGHKICHKTGKWTFTNLLLEIGEIGYRKTTGYESINSQCLDAWQCC